MSHLASNDVQAASCAPPLDGDKGACQCPEQFSGEFTPSTLMDVLRSKASQHPDRRALAFLDDGEIENSSFTYGQLDRKARAIAAALQNMHAPGERVLLLHPPSLDFVAAFFGCLYAGAIAVPVYSPRPGRSLARLQEVAADAEATVALTSKAILGNLPDALRDKPKLDTLRWIDTETVVPQLSREWKPPQVQSDAVAFLQYTSGSTSQPKGVMVTHRNLLYNARMMREAFEITDESRYVCWLPLYHDMGLIGNVLAPICAGVPSILMSPLAFLQRPHRWLQAITRYGAEVSGAPNFAYDLCVRKVTAEQKAKIDLSTWRLAFNGSEPVRADTLARFTAAFAECGFRPQVFYPCYGLAEATLFVSGGSKTARPVLQTIDAAGLERNQVQARVARSAKNRTIVGCGRAWLDEKIVVVDPESMTKCPPGRVGEIWVSGPNVTRGYWNRLEETETTFQAFLADVGAGPFLRTGDLGFIEDGELFVTGRRKDLIIIDGCNHYPQDIEETVESSHPAIRRSGCAAFSIEADSQERLVIVAEIDRVFLNSRATAAPGGGRTCPPPGSQNSCEEIGQVVRRAVAKHHDLQIYALHFVQEGSIPKTSSGKLQRSACRTAFLAGGLAQGGTE